jgi:hypothetical protein
MKHKRTLTIILAAIMTMIFLLTPPAAVQAATNTAPAAVPANVAAALKEAVDENGRAIIIDPAGKMYLFKICAKTGKWSLKKSFRVACGEGLRTDRHYFLSRSKYTDRRAWGDGSRRWAYGMRIDCYEEPVENKYISSYVQKYDRKTKTWVTKKSIKQNALTIAVSEQDALYIWTYYGSGTAVMIV